MAHEIESTYKSRCECGWVGKVRLTQDEAQSDGFDHLTSERERRESGHVQYEIEIPGLGTRKKGTARTRGGALHAARSLGWTPYGEWWTSVHGNSVHAMAVPGTNQEALLVVKA